jgi:FixJ family two-component response regulator
MVNKATVYIIDDDRSVRRALSRLMRATGFEAHTFGDVDQFLALSRYCERACIVADVRLPGTLGLELPALLDRRGLRLPVIFVTAQDGQENRAIARKLGAAGYFRKPVDDQALLDAIEWALSGEREASP